MIYRQKRKKSKSIKKATKTKTNMKNIIRGFIFCALWYLSIIAGFFLLVCPILPLVIISPKKYRRWSDLVFGMWEPFPVAMMEVCFGIRVVLSGDKINPFEGSLFIMNHRTRVDWNFLWLGLFHCCQPNAHNIKYALKSPIMHLPGIGWVMQTCSFIFLYRNWARDEAVLDQMTDYLNESDSLYQILLFPEGTDMTENTVNKSHNYADEHNLPRYYYVLHPRTTGFAFLVNKMRCGGQLKAVYDVTVAYPKTMPLTEVDILRGKFPEEVHFHVKRYDTSEFSFEVEDLKSWLTEIWQRKEERLKEFYATGSFNTTIRSDASSNTSSDQKVDEDVDVDEKVATEEDNKEMSGDFENAKNTSADPEDNKDIPTGLEYDKEISADLENKKQSEVSIGKNTVSSQERESVTTQGSTTSLIEEDECESEDNSRFKNYRPPHLLYIVLAFWIFLIIFTIHQLIYNFYLQIWVLTHSVLFISLSFVSNGFQHLAANVYFYRCNRKRILEKKLE